MNGLPDFTFSIEGEGVSADPATGLVTIAAARLFGGLGAVLTARDAAGTPTDAFRITITATGTPPALTGALADLTLVRAEGGYRVETAAAFSGDNLVFSLEGPGTIDAATGALDLPLGTLRAAETVTVTARNAAGAAVARFALTVTQMAPVATAALGDQVYTLAEGARSISTQALLSGEDLVYSLDAAPPGVTIRPGSGLVTVPTAAALDGAVTVRAANAGGAATLSFRVTVRAPATVFSEAAALSDLGFLATDAAPALTFDTRGFAKLVPATTGRTHGIWTRAGGDGLYRVLARWSSSRASSADNSPFVFGVRTAQAGANLTGAYVEIHRPADVAARGLRIQAYSGAGAATTLLGSAVALWSWDTLYWVEVEVSGGRIRARLYPEAGIAPDWMVTAETGVPIGTGGFGTGGFGAGGFGPGAFPLAGVSPTVLIKRLEFSPIESGIPAAAADADWSLAQITEQAHV